MRRGREPQCTGSADFRRQMCAPRTLVCKFALKETRRGVLQTWPALQLLLLNSSIVTCSATRAAALRRRRARRARRCYPKHRPKIGQRIRSAADSLEDIAVCSTGRDYVTEAIPKETFSRRKSVPHGNKEAVHRSHKSTSKTCHCLTLHRPRQEGFSRTADPLFLRSTVEQDTKSNDGDINSMCKFISVYSTK